MLGSRAFVLLLVAGSMAYWYWRASSSPSREWVDFFVEAITAYLVEQAEPRGYVSDENAEWRIEMPGSMICV